MRRMFRPILAAALAALFALSTAVAPAAAIGIGATGMNITSGVTGSITSTNVLGSTKEDINLSTLEQFTGGTGAGQVDTFYAAQITVAASSSTTLALNGSLTDAFGNTVNFLHVKAILIVAASGNTNDVLVQPGASNAFTGPFGGTSPTLAVSPGETFLLTKGGGSAVGWPVVASTGMNLKLANSSSGTGVTFNIYIWGTST